jgi:hypothetical protein
MTLSRNLQIQKTLNQRRILKNNLESRKLMDLGLYEEAAKLQKPTTEAITKSTDETKKELEQIKNALEIQQPKEMTLSIMDEHTFPTPLEKVQNYTNIKYIPQLSDSTFTLNNQMYDIWQIGSSKSFVFANKNGKNKKAPKGKS